MAAKKVAAAARKVAEAVSWVRLWRRAWKAATATPESVRVPVPALGSPTAYTELLSYIKEHGTVAGLDLSDADLTHAVLDGLNLDGIKLGDYAARRGAQLTNASLVGTSLQGAILCFTDCTGAKMRRADLTDVDLAYAILDQADLRGATLVDADLYRASLERTALLSANLRRADLYLAHLSDTKLARNDLHPPLLHEDKEAYSRFLDKLSTRRGRPMNSLSPPLERSYAIYQSLKTNWRAIGHADDASWAYIHERRAERAMLNPWHGVSHFEGQLQPTGNRSQKRMLSYFYLRRTTSWAFSWLSDLTCGYGEQPWRTLVAAAVVISVFPLLYWVSAGVVTQDPHSSIDLLIYSFGVFSGANLTNFKTTNWQSELLTGMEALLGLGLFALLMFTLGNRLSRL